MKPSYAVALQPLSTVTNSPAPLDRAGTACQPTSLQSAAKRSRRRSSSIAKNPTHPQANLNPIQSNPPNQHHHIPQAPAADSTVPCSFTITSSNVPSSAGSTVMQSQVGFHFALGIDSNWLGSSDKRCQPSLLKMRVECASHLLTHAGDENGEVKNPVKAVSIRARPSIHPSSPCISAQKKE
ncbi:hypothetical protein EJ03DRAFT_10565 [Teratosphaeria nubilosa]|uniref:Uncharacterized protein n=1 Tax=Teratosphaeria nubilosa TaxID=161662 RepID=A0A6G1LHI6_9PEZI|nr:hypothetical protein EJ03DRAFT_10565 [Teratosphaeria nubilosa]